MSKKSTSEKVAETTLGTAICSSAGYTITHGAVHAFSGVALSACAASGIACAPIAVAGGAVVGGIYLVAKLVEYGNDD